MRHIVGYTFVGYANRMAAHREGGTWGDVVYCTSGHQQQLNQDRTAETALGEGPPSSQGCFASSWLSRTCSAGQPVCGLPHAVPDVMSEARDGLYARPLAPVPQHSPRLANASGSGRGRTRSHSTQPADRAATEDLATPGSLPQPSAVLVFPRRLAASPTCEPPDVSWWARACLPCPPAPTSHR